MALVNLITHRSMQSILKFRQFHINFVLRSNISARDNMIAILKTKFPKAKEIEVVDISGGCGAMFEVNVGSEEFKGLSVIKQHRLINEYLKDFIKDMHGIRINTFVPKS